MKVTIGTDIIDVDRVESAMCDENFAHRVFTNNEIHYCEGKGLMKYQHYAARFAAKEATFKAISSKLDNKYDIAWKNIETTNDESGRPRVEIIDIDLQNTGLDKVSLDVSISHLKDYAIATVVATEE